MSRKKLAKARGKERKCIPTEGTAYAKAQRHVKMWCLGNGYNSRIGGRGKRAKYKRLFSLGLAVPRCSPLSRAYCILRGTHSVNTELKLSWHWHEEMGFLCA